jgi:hypothetical protein
MQVPPRLEQIATELAMDSGILHQVMEDGRISEDELPALEEVRDDLRARLVELEAVIAYQMLAIFMFQHAQQPNRHTRRRWQQAQAQAQENAATVSAEAA